MMERMIMKTQIETLVKAIGNDFAYWTSKSRYGDDDFKSERVKEFCEGIVVEEGRKYIRILKDNGGCVWGFVVKEDTKKFRKGDILKAASYKAPATNKARGNIIDGGYTIRWTGPEYLI